MAPLLSPWLPIVSALADILKAAGLEAAKDGIHEFFRTRTSNSKERLLELRNHFQALKSATDELVKETVAGVLTESYHGARERWLSLFAPMQTVLHHFDPRTMGIIEIYSPGLARLFQVELNVTARNLTDALTDEEREFHYATEDTYVLCVYKLFDVGLFRKPS